MEIGNTIFVALGVSGQPSSSPSFSWTKSLIAIVAFCLGALFFSNFHRRLSPLKRWVVISSFAIQTSLVITAASLVTVKVVTHSIRTVHEKADDAQRVSVSAPFPWLDLLPIGLLAFQSAGQIVASRVLKYSILPTMVVTTLYADLMSDAHLLTAGLLEDPQRNRRAAAAVMLFAGAVLGGFLTKSWIGEAGTLWIVAGIKGCMVLCWLLWKRREGHEQIENG